MISQQGEVFEHFDKMFASKSSSAIGSGSVNDENQRCGIVATHRRAADQTTQLRSARLFRAGNEKPTDLIGISGRVALFHECNSADLA
jgi:hypothetical protein